MSRSTPTGSHSSSPRCFGDSLKRPPFPNNGCRGIRQSPAPTQLADVNTDNRRISSPGMIEDIDEGSRPPSKVITEAEAEAVMRGTGVDAALAAGVGGQYGTDYGNEDELMQGESKVTNVRQHPVGLMVLPPRRDPSSPDFCARIRTLVEGKKKRLFRQALREADWSPLIPSDAYKRVLQHGGTNGVDRPHMGSAVMVHSSLEVVDGPTLVPFSFDPHTNRPMWGLDNMTNYPDAIQKAFMSMQRNERAEFLLSPIVSGVAVALMGTNGSRVIEPNGGQGGSSSSDDEDGHGVLTKATPLSPIGGSVVGTRKTNVLKKTDWLRMEVVLGQFWNSSETESIMSNTVNKMVEERRVRDDDDAVIESGKGDKAEGKQLRPTRERGIQSAPISSLDPSEKARHFASEIEHSMNSADSPFWRDLDLSEEQVERSREYFADHQKAQARRWDPTHAGSRGFRDAMRSETESQSAPAVVKRGKGARSMPVYEGRSVAYAWKEQKRSIELCVPVEEGVNADDVNVKFETDRMTITVKDDTLEGELSGIILPGSCLWAMSDAATRPVGGVPVSGDSTTSTPPPTNLSPLVFLPTLSPLNAKCVTKGVPHRIPPRATMRERKYLDRESRYYRHESANQPHYQFIRRLSPKDTFSSIMMGHAIHITIEKSRGNSAWGCVFKDK